MNNRTPLHNVCGNDNLSIVEYLISKVPNIEEKESYPKLCFIFIYQWNCIILCFKRRKQSCQNSYGYMQYDLIINDEIRNILKYEKKTSPDKNSAKYNQKNTNEKNKNT